MVKRNNPPPIESRTFTSPDEIDIAVTKLRRRIKELEELDVQAAMLNDTAAINPRKAMFVTPYAMFLVRSPLSFMSMHI